MHTLRSGMVGKAHPITLTAYVERLRRKHSGAAQQMFDPRLGGQCTPYTATVMAVPGVGLATLICANTSSYWRRR